jgi:hypothetical protein
MAEKLSGTGFSYTITISKGTASRGIQSWMDIAPPYQR